MTLAIPQPLSKAQVLSGLRCHKLLWWLRHEPQAPELRIDEILRDRFDQGRQVGELARRYVPGGALIGSPFIPLADRVELTRLAIERSVPVLYEAAFEAEGVAILVDVLDLSATSPTIIEVKASTSINREHIADAALQVHVTRRAGLPVRRVEVMHLNPQCRYPDLTNLFVRVDVTEKAEKILPAFQLGIPALRACSEGGLPDVPTGDHCTTPDDCPFMDRCWAPLPPYHVTTLHNVRKKKLARLAELGVVTIGPIPDDFELTTTNARQRRAIREGRMIVETSLGPALARIKEPLAFLDFETVSRAIPVWDACKPWDQVPAQLSCHVRATDGETRHFQWLAEGAGDPRRAIALSLIEACAEAQAVLAYNASFEENCIVGLARVFPDLRENLLSIAERLVDLLPIVRDNLYHPAFGGSFSLKTLVPALELGSYDDLEIASGGEATLGLARLLLTTDTLSAEERAHLRAQLLAYCKTDTWCLVRLLDRLRELASAA